MRLHHVFANRSNIGDWLSARGIQRLLREFEPDLEIIEHLCDLPFVADTLARLEQAQPDELIVVGGGGLFMDYFEPFWRGFEPLAGRRRVVLWGVGYVDLKAERSHPSGNLLRRIVARAELAVVRDDLTRDLLGLDLPASIPCPSLAVVVDDHPAEQGVLHVNNYSTVGAEAYDAMRAAGERFAGESGRTFRETNNRIEPGREDDLAAVLDRYRRSDLVLSSALHGCVIAAAMGRPVLAVSGDRKIEGFMGAIGLPEWVLGQDALARLPAMLAALGTQPSVRPAVDRAIAANRAVAAHVAKLLGSPAPAPSGVLA